MDQEITREVQAQKRKRSIIIIIMVVVVLVGLVWMLRTWLNSSIMRSEFTTARVEIGSVENTINASGEVLPEFEEIITSSINGSIKRE